jgi:acyl carrier protein
MDNKSVEQQVKIIISQILKVSLDAIEMDLEIGDLPEWDSLHHLLLIKELEKSFSLKFDQSDLADCEDVNDIVSLISEMQSK